MPFLSWGMCKWHLGFLFIVSPIGVITFFVFSPTLGFLAPTSLLWFDPHLHIWKARLFGVFESSFSSSTNFSSHLQRWDRFYFHRNYCLNYILGELGAYHLNHHIYVFTIRPPIFIRGYKASSWGPRACWRMSRRLIGSGLVKGTLPFQTYLRWARDLLPLDV